MLTERAARGWVDDPDAARDLVRLVLAAAGHTPPAKPLPPEQFRAPTPEPLSGADAARWAELEPLVYDGPADDLVVRGTIEYLCDGERSLTRVQRAGTRIRLSDEGDVPLLMTDGVTVWQRGDDAMIASPHRGPVYSAGDGIELAFHRRREDVQLFGFGQPIGPITPAEHLGRAAWSFAFAAPRHKPNDMRVIIDAATGLILQQQFGDFSLARWTELVTNGPLDPSIFVWGGPVQTQRAMRAARRRVHEADMADRGGWFGEHVTAQPLMNGGDPIEVLLHDWDPDGGFQASLDRGLQGSLARRRRSSEWWNLGWSQVTHRWSDKHWDWALAVWDTGRSDETRLDSSALAALVTALGSSLTDR